MRSLATSLLLLPSQAYALTTTYKSSWTGLPGSIYDLSQPWGATVEASWPPSPHMGKYLQPQEPDTELQAMLEAIDETHVENTITKLVGFDDRHTLSTQNSSTRGIGAARDWIYEKMQAYAKPSNASVEVFFNSYIQDVDGDRITFPNRAYVVTAHYDSRRLDPLDYTGSSPGASDDATGVAVVMEMARICALKKPKATVIFAAVAGEEQGLYGAQHLAQTLKNSSVRVEGNWNVDAVGSGKNEPFYPINDYTVRVFGASIYYPNTSSYSLGQTVANIGGWNDSPSHNLGRYIAEVAAGAAKYVGMQVKLIYRTDRFLRGGDHRRFLKQGFPAVRFTEATEDFKHQHQDAREEDGVQYGDLIEFVDFDYTTRVAEVNLATMWSAANAPAMPTDVTISQEVGFTAGDQDTPVEYVSNDSKLMWNTGSDPLAAGYELVWRPSGALQWSRVLDVGNVADVTVPLGKDNFQFGVRAVGKDGKRSPAVFPLPA